MAGVLVDTHVWLWMLASPDRLSTDARRAVASPSNEVFVSAASSWEIAIKYELGRIDLPEPPERYVPARIVASGCTPLPIEVSHALRAGALPQHHRDPFDRLLIAQAQLMEIPLVTTDRAIAAYEVERIDT